MLVTGELRAAWWELFEPDTPNDVILRAVLVGHCPGMAVVDCLEDPTEILVRAHGGKAFANRGATEAFLHAAIDQARKLGWTALADTGIPESVRSHWRTVDRVRFEDCDLESERLQSLRDRHPSGFEVGLLDREVLSRCHHAKRELLKGYGDRLDEYFGLGYGVCLLHEDNIACEAYTSVIAAHRMEAVVGTLEAFRGRGLASCAAATLAEESRRRGHTLTWNCLADNVGSLKVAKRLGFRSERPYREIYY